MKKCGKILLFSLVALLLACTPKSTAEEEKNNNTVEQPQDAASGTITISDTIHIDSYDPESPALSMNLTFEPIRLDNNAATEKAIEAISYALSGTESKNLEDACNAFARRMVAEYEELRPDYIDIKSNSGEAFWMNHYCTATGTCIKGYRGYVNYLVNYDEYKGGAHPSNYTLAMTFDPTDGHEVTLDEIMEEGYEEALLPIIIEELMEFFGVSSKEKLGEILFDMENRLFVTKNVILDKDYIIFIYNHYEIAPYAAGTIILDVEYSKLKGILK